MDPIRAPQTLRPRTDRQGRYLVLGIALFLAAQPAFAASTGTTSLIFVGNSGRPAAVGDYVSATLAGGGIASPYRFWLEVPPGISRLRVQLFDADIGTGGATESAAGRDRFEGNGGPIVTGSTVVYTLLRPDGTTASSLTCDDTGAAPCVGANNAWLTLFNSTTDKAPGHWELRAEMTSNPNGLSINPFGLRADDGDETSAGTEVNIYFDSFTILGVNADEATATRSYTHYPYITSGCTFSENDYDFDVGGTNTGLGAGGSFGQVDLTGPAGTARTILSANLSTNATWKRNTIARWTTDRSSTEYGTWTASERISQFLGGNGVQNNNYAPRYYANDQAAAGNPTGNPIANVIRTYLPTDGGASPAKPYLEQLLTCVACSGNPISVGATSIFQVTVRLVNPKSAGTMTFSASNQITANIPGGDVRYFGNEAASVGTITAHPSAGGSGTISWNPGTVGPTTTAILTYQLSVTPSAAGRIVVTGTPGTNGTTARFVDLTGNTTQARSTYSTGGLCELATDTSVTNPAVVSGLSAHRVDGGVAVEWTTASEVGTTGFDLYRFDPAARSFAKRNDGVLPALVAAPQGGRYRWIDRQAPPRGPVLYQLVEHLADGGTRPHGPFLVPVEPARAGDEAGDLPALLATPWTPAAAPGGLAEPADAFAKAAGPAPSVLIGLRDTGLYRLSAARLADTFGLAEKELADRLAGRLLRLASRGREVPWWSEGGALLFYGQAPESPYARDNVYQLTLEAAAPTALTPAGNPLAPAAEGSFAEALHLEQDRLAATVIATRPDADYWYWDYVVGGSSDQGSKGFAAELPGLAAGEVRLAVHLQGATAGAHHAVVRIDGHDLGDVRWSGIAPADAVLDVPPSLVREAGNTFEVAGLLDPGTAESIFYIDGFDVTYPRRRQAVGDALTVSADGAPLVTVGGFSAPSVRLLDVTQPNQPRQVAGALITPGSAGVRVTWAPSSPTARYFAAGPGAIREPRWLRPGHPPHLRSPGQGAEYLVITTAPLLAAAEELAAWRRSQGLASQVVDLADVLDEFNDGIASPYALRDFLRHARQSWRPAPRYVVLAGSGTFDYRDLLGLGGNLVPPLLTATPNGLFASDNALLATAGPGLSIGRIPVSTAADLSAYVAKLKAYESAPRDARADRAVLLADADGRSDFAPDAEGIAGFLPPNFAPHRIFLSRQGPEAARGELLADLAAGVGLLSYIGHGALDRLSAQGLLTTADVERGLGKPVPLVTAFTCVLNRFDIPGFTPLGAAYANAPGGALAVYAPTGLNDNATGRTLGALFYQTLARAGQDVRLGDVIRRTLVTYAASGGTDDQAGLYTLLGDPALLLQKKAPPEPQPHALPPDPTHPSG